jgi:hypothetical protein
LFARGAVGLSTEAEELSGDHLSAERHRLVWLMRLLGPSLLRVGGDSVDSSWWTSDGEPPPSWATNTVTPADLDVLHGLLHATGWRVLLGVDLGHFEPERAADEVHYASAILGTSLVGVEIGNEPDDFSGKKDLRPRTYDVAEYLSEAEAYREALGRITPGVPVYGPALSGTSWLTKIGPAARIFTEITQHYYPAVACSQTAHSEPQPPVEELLSPTVRALENEVLEVLAEAGALADRPTRIGETNTDTAACGETFASALWALDWVLRAVSDGVSGVNFHGDLGFCGDASESPICVSRDNAVNIEDVTAQPEYYGLVAASQLEGGRFVSTRLTAPDPLPSLTAWATVAPNGTVRVAIDNLTTAGAAQPVSVPTVGYTATQESLIGSSAEAKSGITFGGAHVIAGERWRPRPVGLRPAHGSVRVVIRPASAVIVTLHPTPGRAAKVRAVSHPVL